MNRKLTTLFILFFMAVSAIALPGVSDELIGNWSTDTLIVEMDDGLLVAPEAAYSWPYLGIREISILDSGFILFRTDKGEHRAFYEIQQLDFDNVHLSCIFKSGEQLLLKLMRINSELWKFLYRVPADSELADFGDDESEADQGTEDLDGTADEKPSIDQVDVPESLYSGILKRHK